MSGNIRAFAAIDIEDTAKTYINDALSPLRALGLHASWTKAENLHITLNFFGNIDTQTLERIQEGLCLAAKEHDAFDFNIEGVGWFPQKSKPKILWLGIKEGNEQLCTLAQAIEKHCPRQADKTEKEYHAHLTIARIKTPPQNTQKLQETINALKITGQKQRAASIRLFKSTLTPHGPVYEVLKEFRLA